MGGLLLLLSTLFMSLTAFSDPGTVPRASAELVAAYQRHGQPVAPALLINGLRVQTKFCNVCGVLRPPRASHCRETDRCIEKWDHYCPWVGTAIGRRNYRWFLLFVLSTVALAGYAAVASVSRLVLMSQALDVTGPATRLGPLGWRTPADAPRWLRATAAAPLSVLVGLYCAIVGALLAVLLSYHLHLIALNQTTYENVRGVYEAPGSNPFDRGVLHNLAEACLPCCVPPSEPEVIEDDVESGGRRGGGGLRGDADGSGGGNGNGNVAASPAARKALDDLDRLESERSRAFVAQEGRRAQQQRWKQQPRPQITADGEEDEAEYDGAAWDMPLASMRGGGSGGVPPNDEPPPSPTAEPWDDEEEEAGAWGREQRAAAEGEKPPHAVPPHVELDEDGFYIQASTRATQL